MEFLLGICYIFEPHDYQCSKGLHFTPEDVFFSGSGLLLLNNLFDHNHFPKNAKDEENLLSSVGSKPLSSFAVSILQKDELYCHKISPSPGVLTYNNCLPKTPWEIALQLLETILRQEAASSELEDFHGNIFYKWRILMGQPWRIMSLCRFIKQTLDGMVDFPLPRDKLPDGMCFVESLFVKNHWIFSTYLNPYY